MPRLLVITSTTRPGRVGTAVADWVLGLAREHGGFEVELADLAEIGLPFLDEPDHPSEGAYIHAHTRAWSKTVEAADAFLILAAEYNRGITAPLKNALDSLYAEWAAKPVGFVSYGMSSAGLRAVEMITQVAVALGMTPLPDIVTLPLREVQDADGRLIPGERRERGVHALLEELRRYSEALGQLRKPAAA
ncbi:NADPH-dependent FMN reductase [Catenulispora acidiphila DSM 44928]|uniref:NADPH-dependent FMN reductase n=1 Tax=Catenulispora acidiphila (strain DSM 44928 / JCM 14897 / NBRC 102108 / NRRL B-24433 / ID139908) TaxID=479433 RepID=C7Q7E6_CATAD|nr:NAD(P)H-dependent oxidoreductase [Catenulispora acidiphila]ACU70234.1 NADPH-dependent FMN reductase [Catenulispora acidiphila DSM 44928]